MTRAITPITAGLALFVVVSGCGGGTQNTSYVEPVGGAGYEQGPGVLTTGTREIADANRVDPIRGVDPVGGPQYADDIGNLPGDDTLFDLFTNVDDPNVTLEVNRYIWTAALDVLNFLPVESSDPFSGVFTTGFGVPPGGGRAYRATVYVQDPSLDARALNVSLFTRAGPAAPDTVRAVEDAILTRARQLRVRDRNL
ncbi:MAG: DUF3576 domain-containing protein [Pseudomonadota bacterium]